jgi:hypothetical protein
MKIYQIRNLEDSKFQDTGVTWYSTSKSDLWKKKVQFTVDGILTPLKDDFIQEEWRMPSIDERYKDQCDIGIDGYLFVSDLVFDKIEPYIKDYFEVLQPRCPDKKYKMLNPIKALDVLNTKKSSFFYDLEVVYKRSNDKLTEINYYAFNEDIVQNLGIFTHQLNESSSTRYFVTEEVRKILQDPLIKLGIDFRLVWDSENPDYVDGRFVQWSKKYAKKINKAMADYHKSFPEHEDDDEQFWEYFYSSDYPFSEMVPNLDLWHEMKRYPPREKIDQYFSEPIVKLDPAPRNFYEYVIARYQLEKDQVKDS